METLPPKTQEQIEKLSTAYLVLKLTKAGIDEEAILKMSREQLMAAWAELVATGKDKPAAAVSTRAVGPSAATAYYDPEIEKQRLAFEMQKYEEDKAERLRLEAKADAERLRIDAERLRLETKAEEERLRLEAKAEAKAEAERIRLEQERMRLEEKAEAERIRLEYQFEWQRAQAAEESARQQAQFEWQRAQAIAEKNHARGAICLAKS